ncbi:hypothetical protein WOLCODRAFT_135234 [Wolfiporia cocos MD-104 SS10]|uniref:J domain-containing protein n=1 Tax=Wolfiporia cocos (strain MD-104) TaxID=742152 RepID=A0A2H3J4G6_WOLCO|nr:hypothetical protein WOLCODRAFT_135234 [Wolfiporia cocos MD-104 SS10]
MLRRLLAASLPRLAPAARILPHRPAAYACDVLVARGAFVSSWRRYSAPSAERPAATCPQCSAPLPSALPACTQCYFVGKLDPAHTYHDLLGMSYEPNPFAMDSEALKQSYRRLMRVVHPDRWHGKGEGKVEAAQTLSSGIVAAYQKLENPMLRIQYILEHEGFPITEDDSGGDPEILHETMEYHEMIDEADTPEKLQAIGSEISEKIETVMEEITTLVGQKRWEDSKKAAVRLKYLLGIRTALSGQGFEH